MATAIVVLIVLLAIFGMGYLAYKDPETFFIAWIISIFLDS